MAKNICPCNSRGFTLVELMIGVLISIFVGGAIYATYTSQQKIYRFQENVVDMQQNSRAGLYLLSKELRMAGYDPLGATGAAILQATNTSIQFTQDITDPLGNANDGDGLLNGPNENVTITFDDFTDPVNPRITRDFDGPGGVLPQPFLNNIDFFEFIYTLDDGNITRNPTATERDRIEVIQVNMLIRSSSPDPDVDMSLLNFDYPPAEIFTEQYDPNNPPAALTPITRIAAGTYGDSFRRRLASISILCRNASL